MATNGFSHLSQNGYVHVIKQLIKININKNSVKVLG